VPLEDNQTLDTGKCVLVKFYFDSVRTQIYGYVCSVLEVLEMELKTMDFKALYRKDIFKAAEDNLSVN
jgi:hypothetical protein